MSVITNTVAKLATNVVSKEVDALQKQVEQLRSMNNQLQEALHAAQTGAISMCGYLSKHRPVSELWGLFSQEWELRYLVLTGTTLRYYKSERDAASFGPRGVVDVQGCIVEVEPTSNRNTIFSIIDPCGHVLLRLKCDSKSSAEKWLSALEDVGLRVAPAAAPPTQEAESHAVAAADHAKQQQHLSAAAVAAAAVQAGASTTCRLESEPGTPKTQQQQQQERWEAYSTDSELPEMPGGVRRGGRPPVYRKQLEPGRAVGMPAYAGEAARAAPSAPSSSSRIVIGYPNEGGGQRAAAVRQQSTREAKGSEGAAGVQRSPMVGSTPVHVHSRYSYLSSDGVWTAKHDGLLNLGMVILIVTNFRLILENLLKYGLRMQFFNYIGASLHGKGNLPLVLAFPALVLFALIGLCSELLGASCLRYEEQYRQGLLKKETDGKAVSSAMRRLVRINEMLIITVHVVNTTAALLLPCCIIHWTKAEAGPGFLLTLCTIVVWMKLVSYAHCNADLRAARRSRELRSGERGSREAPAWALLQYPENLTVGNMLFFLAVPTLVYQVNFPRTERIRKRWLLRRLSELAVFLGLLLFMANQYLAPAITNSITPLNESDWVRVVERVLKLALPTLYCWLAMFYCLFHLWLNILAELTCFGDREFYKDWWNAATIGDYWKLWNMPVHKWLLRTVYFPAMRAGVGRYGCMLLVFLVSAVFHEVAVGVPLHMVRFHAFAGIMLQVPMISITENLKKHLKSDTWGNYVFWITFCVVGQPVSLMMYCHDYVVSRQQAALAAAAAGTFGVVS